MKILRDIVKTGMGIRRRLGFNQKKAADYQQKTLKKLLSKAQNTKFGEEYNFEEMLNGDTYREFSSRVPIHTYESMQRWWQHSLNGENSVCWPGKVKYFALSSGTSEGSSKYIPVTNDQLKAIKRASFKQIIQIAKTDLPKDYLTKHYLMIGGSTELEYNGVFYSGDLSGITTSNVPAWFERFSKPEMFIRKSRNWAEKIDFITSQADKYDVVMIAGVPAWIQLLFENIIRTYKLKNIHDIWPNFTVYIHGGVALEPYRKSLDRLFGKPVMYFETYLASEGFLAFQARPDAKGMKLILKNGIFFEFVPFNSRNFTEEGVLKPDPEVLVIDEVEEDTEYAVLISTCAGAWRYMIGDVVRFVSVQDCEVKISGRTKHYLSLCGEHLSVDNMNQAIEIVAHEFNREMNEYTVAGIPYEGVFAHHWFIACDRPEGIDTEKLKIRLDETLKKLNDDYAVERKHALREIFVEILPHQIFLDWMRKKGKEGAQHKFPRVLNKTQLEEWEQHLQEARVQQ